MMPLSNSSSASNLFPLSHLCFGSSFQQVAGRPRSLGHAEGVTEARFYVVVLLEAVLKSLKHGYPSPRRRSVVRAITSHRSWVQLRDLTTLAHESVPPVCLPVCALFGVFLCQCWNQWVKPAMLLGRMTTHAERDDATLASRSASNATQESLSKETMPVLIRPPIQEIHRTCRQKPAQGPATVWLKA